jgi:hypothetical protein
MWSLPPGKNVKLKRLKTKYPGNYFSSKMME